MMITIEQAHQIPKLIEEGKTLKEIAEGFNTSIKSVSDRIKRLREAGVEVKTRKGRRPMKLI